MLADLSSFLGNVFFALLMGVVGLGAGWILHKKYGNKI